jgi:uncharacterized membrane protein
MESAQETTAGLGFLLLSEIVKIKPSAKKMSQLIIIFILLIGVLIAWLRSELSNHNLKFRIGLNACLLGLVIFTTYALTNAVYTFERMSLSIQFGRMLELIEKTNTL